MLNVLEFCFVVVFPANEFKRFIVIFLYMFTAFTFQNQVMLM